MIRIQNSGRFPKPIAVTHGDCFVLWIDGKEVHRASIERIQTITYWACIEIGEGGLGYVIGDKRLERDLKRMAGGSEVDEMRAAIQRGLENDLARYREEGEPNA